MTGYSLTVEHILEYEQALATGTLSGAIPSSGQVQIPRRDESTESRHLSFAELKMLIEQGKTDEIPNNKVVSEALNVSIAHAVDAVMLICFPLGCTSK